MLRKMRENFKSLSWSLWLIIIVFIGGFVFFGDGLNYASGADTTIVSVNGDDVKAEAFSKALYNRLDTMNRNYRRQTKKNISSQMIQQAGIVESLLSSMVVERIIAQECEKRGISVTKEEIDEGIVRHPALQNNGTFMGENYKEILQNNGISVKDFRNDIKNSIYRDKLSKTVSSSVVIPESELKKDFFMENDSAEVEFIILKTDRIKDKIKTEKQDLQKFYEKNKTMFMSEEKRSASVVVFNYKDYKKDVKVTKDEIRKYYKEHKKELNGTYSKVKDKIEKNLERQKLREVALKNGKDIYNKIKDSDNLKKEADTLKLKCIETGFLKSGDNLKDIDKTGSVSRRLFSAELNKITFPVEFMDGIAIVQLKEIKEPSILPFEKAEDKVKEKYTESAKVEKLVKQASEVNNRINKISKKEDFEKYLKKEELASTVFTYKRGNKLSTLPVSDGLDEFIFTSAENEFLSPRKFDNDVVLIKVKSRKINSDEDFKKAKSEFYKTKISEAKNRNFNSYISGKMKEYREKELLKYNLSLFNRVKKDILSRYK